VQLHGFWLIRSFVCRACEALYEAEFEFVLPALCFAMNKLLELHSQFAIFDPRLEHFGFYIGVLI
jgi:hypothetical protein